MRETTSVFLSVRVQEKKKKKNLASDDKEAVRDSFRSFLAAEFVQQSLKPV
jgi:hypothetical protein